MNTNENDNDNDNDNSGKCECGSGLYPESEYDARGIYLCRACPKCKKKKLSRYRKDVLSNPNYYADEPIYSEEELY